MSKVIIAGSLVLLSAVPAIAQSGGRAKGADSIRARVAMEHQRRSEDWLSALRPVAGNVSRARQDQLADSLARSAVQAAFREADDYTSLAIVNTLSAAGDRVADGARRGIPYDGAAERLMSVYRLAPATA